MRDERGLAHLGDGDYLMGCTALRTAVSNEIPLLVVVANNGSYFNDVHQENVARMRKRPITKLEDMRAAFERGLAEVRAGRVCEIDVHVHRNTTRASLRV